MIPYSGLRLSDGKTSQKDLHTLYIGPFEGFFRCWHTFMLSNEKIKKIAPELSNLSDEELEVLRIDMYETVQIAFEAWWLEKFGSKNPTWSFPDSKDGGTV
jgi:hypothetical protein